MKKLLLLFTCVLNLAATQELTININQREGKFTYYFTDKHCCITCAHCDKDISQEDSYIVAFAESGPYAYFLCKDCNDEYYRLLMEDEKTEGK